MTVSKVDPHVHRYTLARYNRRFLRALSTPASPATVTLVRAQLCTAVHMSARAYTLDDSIKHIMCPRTAGTPDL